MTYPVNLLKSEKPLPAAKAQILRLPGQRPDILHRRVVPALQMAATRVLPPLVTILLMLGIWQIICSAEGATLPSPARICQSRLSDM